MSTFISRTHLTRCALELDPEFGALAGALCGADAAVVRRRDRLDHRQSQPQTVGRLVAAHVWLEERGDVAVRQAGTLVGDGDAPPTRLGGGDAYLHARSGI